MIENDAVKMAVESALPGSEVSVQGDGYHYEVKVVSDAFEGKSKVQRQQAVYRALNASINSGDLHAITMTTLTSTEQAGSQHG